MERSDLGSFRKARAHRGATRLLALGSILVCATSAAGACSSSSQTKRVPDEGGAGGAAGEVAQAGEPQTLGGTGGTSSGGATSTAGSAGEGGAKAGGSGGEAGSGAAADEGGAAGSGGAMGSGGAPSACEDGALQFSGAQWVDIPNTAALHLKTAMTLEGWVKSTSPVAVEAIFFGKHSCGTDNGYFLEIYTNSLDGAHVPNAPAFYVGANNQHAYGTASIVDGQWHHVAGTWDGTTSKLYVDGVFIVSKTAAYQTTNTTNLGLGAVTGGTCRGFAGTLDEVSLWSVARTAEQVAADAAAPIDKSAAGLEAYYDFNASNCGQALLDRSSHARDGVLGGTSAAEAQDPVWVSDGPFSR